MGTVMTSASDSGGNAPKSCSATTNKKKKKQHGDEVCCGLFEENKLLFSAQTSAEFVFKISLQL